MILIVDDEKYIRSSLSGLLNDEGYQTITAESAEKAEKILETEKIDAILLDIQMPGKDGITFLDDNKVILENIPVMIISGKSDIPTAVMAIKLGCCDYIEKPLVPERILVTIKHMLRLSQSLENEKKLTVNILDRYRIIGQSDAINDLHVIIKKAAASDATILITGQNGVGKELVVNNIHYYSDRRAEPLVTVNCPAIPDELFESELFGHAKGAFTGALADRAGRFETAGAGTLFLDEIGDLSAQAQTKLLRVLETGQYEKVGSSETLQSDCRIIAATNQDLKKMVAESKFREDLFYRLNVIMVNVPSLSERIEDIPVLIDYFLMQFCKEQEYCFSPESIGLLSSQEWPGNIRQLKNFIQQIIFYCEPGEISVSELNSFLKSGDFIESNLVNSGDNRLVQKTRQFEKGYLSDLSKKHNGNIASMARYLGMDRGNLSKKLKALGIV